MPLPATHALWLARPIAKVFADLLIFNIMVHAINEKRILPNMTLGYFICDNCGDATQTVYNILHILSGYNEEAPNYSCSNQGEVIGFVGSNVAMAELLGIFGYLQISYGTTDPVSNIHNTNSYFNIAHSSIEMDAIILFIKAFGWNWIGIMMSSDDNAESKLQEVTREFTKYGICIAYIVKLTTDIKTNQGKLNIILKSTARVMLVFGTFLLEFNQLMDLDVILQNITLIIHESWIFNFVLSNSFSHIINGSFILTTVKRQNSKLIGALNNISRKSYPGDPILENIYYFYFGCTDINPETKEMFQSRFKDFVNSEKVCSDDYYKLGRLLMGIHFPSYYYVSSAVYILAHAAHEMQKLEPSGSHRYRNKLQKYIRRLNFLKGENGNLYFKTEELYHSLHLIQFTIFLEEDASYKQTFFAKFSKSPSGSINFQMNPERIVWNDGKKNPKLLKPGGPHRWSSFRERATAIVVPTGYQGEDNENCQRCPDEEWPDERKVKCISKRFEYLSYEEDPLAPSIAVISFVGSVITAIVLKIFISFWDTPVVKANNRTVSIILLTSILLSFLCVFLFLGRPVDITCMLRQVSFGISFSVAVSCVLAKTIIVCIAFKSTKPGSYWNKWVGIQLGNYIVIICSSVQALICVIWLSASAPYQEYDMFSYSGKIIVQCNEGSVTCFYMMLSYLGFLAAVSFVLAFMVRTLPDSFNEAKYITFSMLVFCSVWIAMIPAYLSTRGKYMVAVEIFAILSSSAGLLGCLFSPKLYFIVMKPELNSRQLIKGSIT
ncbi:vomeronasal type-2 receptor 26-like [Gastrophryne carolinensis]